MSDLTAVEKRKLERLFQMGSGHVLNFYHSTLAEFVLDSTGRDLRDSKYDLGSGKYGDSLRIPRCRAPHAALHHASVRRMGITGRITGT